MTGAIASFGGIGRVPVAPGTCAALAALPLAWALHWLGGFPLLLVATAAGLALGWRAVRVELARAGDRGPAPIVIDAVVGQWVALFPLSAGLWLAGAALHVFPWPGWVGAFLAFRLLAIWRPGPIARAGRMPGAAGVMVDDLLAGLLAAAAVAAAAALAHGVLL